MEVALANQGPFWIEGSPLKVGGVAKVSIITSPMSGWILQLFQVQAQRRDHQDGITTIGVAVEGEDSRSTEGPGHIEKMQKKEERVVEVLENQGGIRVRG